MTEAVDAKKQQRTNDAKKRSSVLSERIMRRTDVKLQKLIAEFSHPLSFLPLDELMISPAAWKHVASSGIDPKTVFAHPKMLSHHPETSEYYRGIALLSRKRVAAIAASVESWESPESKRQVTAEQAKVVARLYNAVISSIIEGATDWTLENGYRNIIANMGIGLDGSIRNLIGQDAENMVKERILQWLDDRGLAKRRDAQGARFDLPNGYSMHYDGAEPDIEFRQNKEGEERVAATIEIKGGTDPAGALERLGAVQKSFEATPASSINILIAGIVTAEMGQQLLGMGLPSQHPGNFRHSFLIAELAYAAEAGVAIVCPDTSPRGEGVPDNPDGAYDLTLGWGLAFTLTPLSLLGTDVQLHCSGAARPAEVQAAPSTLLYDESGTALKRWLRYSTRVMRICRLLSELPRKKELNAPRLTV